MTQNCYKSIKVSDRSYERDNDRKFLITTINCDGVPRFWESDSMEEFIEWWHEVNYGGPAWEDHLVEFSFRAFNGSYRFHALVGYEIPFGELLACFGKV